MFTNKSEKFWDQSADNYDKTERRFEYIHSRSREYAKEHLRETDVVLDYGCGGALAPTLPSNSCPKPGPEAPGSVRSLCEASLLFGAVVLLLGGCSSQAPPQAKWLPDDAGWTLRDVDEHKPATWVSYDRVAPGTDIKEIRVVGLVHAPPKTAMRALRQRLLDESYQPDNVEAKVLHETELRILTYALAKLPWPFKDREITEQMDFTEDVESGALRIDVRNVETEGDVPRGVLRVPLVRNRFVVASDEKGGSIVTMDSIHDLGGSFPNWVVYGPIRKGMVDVLFEVREISTTIEEDAALAL